MALCLKCGESNAEQARFCSRCGTPLGAPEQRPREVRKTVTVLFCDLVGSTKLGEQLDSETLRAVLDRYFKVMRSAIENHGGTVEKFIGDAVMAVFGAPVMHEDDALRAVRAALDMRTALVELNTELESRWGTRLESRTGINTGEVVTGSAGGATLATGDAVNVAARLEQRSEPSQILIGPETHRLVRDRVRCEITAPLELKGKTEAVKAYLVVSATSGEEVAGRLDSPLVGRDRELSALNAALERVQAADGSELLAVVGEAGLGKSRLKREFIESHRSDAAILEGTCLPYGEGISYWPIAQIVRQAAGIAETDSSEEACRKLGGLMEGAADGPVVADRVATLIGLAEGVAAPEEMAWAVQRLLDRIAEGRPLVVIVEDLHWAEEALVRLIEQITVEVRQARVLFVCLARPEVSDAHLRMLVEGAGRRLVELAPLEAEEGEALMRNLLGRMGLEKLVVERVAANAQGNPLFLEEYLRMLVDDGWLVERGGSWAPAVPLSEVPVPATIGALLGTRVDRLPGDEREVMERAAVVGEEFWREAVTELSVEAAREAVGRHLAALLERALVERAEDPLAFGEAYRFRHILIRDAAYRATLKSLRSQLHERFAAWLTARVGERLGEYEEVVGHHLEQAYRLRVDLAPEDEESRALARTASERLASSGRRALSRSDLRAATNLLERSISLLPRRAPREGDLAEQWGPDDEERTELSLSLGDALIDGGEVERADAVLAEIERDLNQGHDRLAARALVMRSFLDLYRGELDPGDEAVLASLRGAEGVFAKTGDDAGSSQALRFMADLRMGSSLYGLAVKDLELALEHAQRAGEEREVSVILTLLASTLFWGPAPASDAIRRCDQILEQGKGRRVVEMKTKLILAGLHGMTGEFELGRRLHAQSSTALEELGLSVAVATGRQISGMIELLAGERESAVREYRHGYEALKEMGQLGFLAGAAAPYARAQLDLDPAADVNDLIADVRTASVEDPLAQADHDLLEALLRSRSGEHETAIRLVDAAVAAYDATDELKTQADAAVDASRVLEASGEHDRAVDALRRARVLYERKGVVIDLRPVAATVERPGT